MNCTDISAFALDLHPHQVGLITTLTLPIVKLNGKDNHHHPAKPQPPVLSPAITRETHRHRTGHLSRSFPAPTCFRPSAKIHPSEPAKVSAPKLKPDDIPRVAPGIKHTGPPLPPLRHQYSHPQAPHQR